jgi:hypothetical protein
VANFPPVSTTPAANFATSFSVVDTGGKFATGVNDAGCRYLKVNLKAKMYICVTSTIQRCPNKIIKIFLTEDFFHLPPVSTTPVVNLGLRISPLQQNSKRSKWDTLGLGGKLIDEKNQKQKIS